MIYLGLGSNMGEREQYLRQAVNTLGAHPDIRIIQKSAIYETEPFGYTDQAAFLNAVIAIETNLTPAALLKLCLETESSLGRVRDVRWGPRTIDIDILLFHNQLIHTEALTVPHPYLQFRPFVLIPLRDLTGDGIILHGLTAGELLTACEASAVTYYQSFD
jgi:2-amino-4-hydroxy-6-hydroxymethyldihydropteridine diphosphokinase